MLLGWVKASEGGTIYVHGTALGKLAYGVKLIFMMNVFQYAWVAMSSSAKHLAQNMVARNFSVAQTASIFYDIKCI